MLQLLIATDFSDVAQNACRFACNMATDCKASIVLLHSFMIPVNFNEDPMMMIPLNEGQELAEERLQVFAAQLQKEFPQLVIESLFMLGKIADCIEEYSNYHKISFVVMGNSGEGSSALWLGSNVTSVMKHVSQPVLAIPATATYTRPQKLCFACDFKQQKNHEQLQQLAVFIKEIGAHLHVLNVDENNKGTSAESIYEDTIVHYTLRELAPEYHLLQGKNIDEIINEFVQKMSIDWLIIAPHYHSFFERIFHKSHTASMIQRSHVPLLAIHEK